MQAVAAEPAHRARTLRHQSGAYPLGADGSAGFAGRLKAAPERIPLESPTPLIVCDPQGAKDNRLAGVLNGIEPQLLEMAATHNDVGFAIASVDKSRQSAINKLGGANGAGDMAIEAHFDILAEAASCAIDGGRDMDARLIRVSPGSDEGIPLFYGRKLPQDIASRFRKAIKIAKRETDLRAYKYTMEVPYGENQAFDLDLHSFSKALRNPEMVVSCKMSMAGTSRVCAVEKEGFIMERLRNLENNENAFFGMLPDAFSGIGGGIAEVQTPFSTSLKKLGVARMGRGVFVEIKLRADREDALDLLPFTHDTIAWLGTRKGYMEIFSALFGMRGFNTFLGKARTNSVLSPITHAMHDLTESGAFVVPVNGCYLQYWVDMPGNAFTAELIRKSIERRINAKGAQGPEFADLAFTPSVSLLDARGVDLSELRARFILKSLGKEGSSPQVLDMSDFVLNFLENVHPIVQERVFGRLAEEANMHLTEGDRRNIAALRSVCAFRRTIRDTEDMAWVLRNDRELPDGIRSKSGELEKWLFGFSGEKAGKMFLQLAREISAIGRRR